MAFVGLALLASISPQTLAAVLYLLGGPHGVRNTWAFLGGEMITSVVSGALVAVGIADLGISASGIGHGRKFPIAYITFGILLLAMAAWVLWRGRHPREIRRLRRRGHDPRKAEARLERMSASWRVALGVGILFGLPSGWLALALAEIAGHGVIYTGLSLVLFTVIAYSWGWIPMLWFLLDRERAVRRLAALRAWVVRHHVAIITAVLSAVGAYLIAFGVITA